MGSDSTWVEWRKHLPSLEGLPLLPVGAGAKFKAPIDPSNGALLAEWQNHSWGPKAIGGMGAVVKCVGINCLKTKELDLLILDIDGATAVDLCLSTGALMEDVGWRILRNTSSDRLKAVFKLTPDTHSLLCDEQGEALGHLKTTTKAATQNPKAPAEQIELFYGNGQCIVLGEHKTSGGYYEWIGSPDKVKEPTPEWWMVIQKCIQDTQLTKSKEREEHDGTIVQSGALTPCPICGRDHSPACSTYIDREPGKPRRVNCMKGQSFSPPLEVATKNGGSRTWMKGDKYRGEDGTLWEYKREGFNPAIGEFITFLEVLEPQEQAPEQQEDAPQVINPDVMPGAMECTGRRQRLAPDEILFYLPHVLGGEPRLNIRTGDVDLPDRTLSANSIGGLYLRLSTPQAVWDKGPTVDALMLLASESSFDPVEEYLNGITMTPLPMDQWESLDQCLLGIDDPIARKFLPRYLISAVARIFEPGCDYRQTLVLVGPQWRGKSALGRILFGRDHWVEGVGDLGRDALMKCQKGWGVELAELDGVTRRADQERLKAFLTETVDTFRAPYDRAAIPHPRRFVFWATSNAPPLRDSTGSTRFVTVGVPDKMLPLDWAQQHRDAIWARAVQQYRSGVEWRFGDEQERIDIAQRNEDHTESDPWTDEVVEFLEKNTEDVVTVPALLDHLGIGKERQNNHSSQRVRQIAEKAGWVYKRARNKVGNRQQGFWPPCPHRPHRGHTAVHTEERSEASASAGVSTPSIPKPKDLSGINRKDVDIRVDMTAEKSLNAFGVDSKSRTPHRSSLKASGEPAGMDSGMDSGVDSPKKAAKPRPFLKDSFRNEDNDELYDSLWQG